MKRVLILAVLVATLLPQSEMGEDKTLSPYFVIVGEGETEMLPLLSTSAEVDIAGVIADVTVTQVYKNDGEDPIEAIYVFPASTRAAVYGMEMRIGERTIVAEIKEREQARQEYEDAKAEGKSASLLEQQRPNVFQMNVANIMPGDRIEVELKYTELLVPEDGVYSFIYPTVVGPRYSETQAEDATDRDKWIANPFLEEGTMPTYDFDIDVNISAGLTIADISCETHTTSINYDGRDFARIDLSPLEEDGGNRDFVLNYRLKGGDIESGVLLYEGEDENFFLMMVQPPERVDEKQMPAREYIFIVDVSGSMHGFPLDISKELMKNLLGELRPQDRFNVLLFASGNTVMSESSLPATKDNVSKAMKIIDNQHGGGGTQLLPALKRALDLPGDDDISRTVVVVTDGYVSVEKEAFEIIRNNLNRANFFAFGIGSSVNRFIIEGMAHVGNGEPFVILNPEGAEEKAEKFRQYIATPVLTDIEIEYDGIDVYDIEPLKASDLLAERPLLVYGKYRGKANGKITVTGEGGRGEFEQSYDLSDIKPIDENSALKYLWARQRIRILGDFGQLGDNVKEEVTELGLKYNLLTDYTSFVAIDSEIRNTSGDPTSVKQPLPLPQGVSQFAVASGGNYRMAKSMAPMGASAPVMTEDVMEMPQIPKDEKRDLSLQTVNIKRIMVDGDISEDDIENFVKSLNLERCIHTHGEITVEFTVTAKGKIENVRIVATSLPQSETDCTENKFTNGSFPQKPARETTIKVTLGL